MLQYLNEAEGTAVEIYDGFIPETTTEVTITGFDRGTSDKITDKEGKPRKMWVFTTDSLSEIYLTWVEGSNIGRLCRWDNYTQNIGDGIEVRHCGSFVTAFAEFHKELKQAGKRLTNTEIRAKFKDVKVKVTPYKAYRKPYIKAGETPATKDGRKCYVYHIDIVGKETEFPYKELCAATYAQTNGLRVN